MKSFHPFWPIIVPTISAIAIIYFTIQHEKSLFTVEIENTLQHIIVIDMNNRLQETNEVFSYVYDPEARRDGTKAFLGKDQKSVDKEKINKKLSAQQKNLNFLQTYLLTKNPIKVLALDSLFQSEIRKESSKIETNIIYKESINNTSQIKDENFSSSFLTIKIPEIFQGVNDEISIQAYAKLPLELFFTKSKNNFLLTIIIWLVSMGILTPIFLHRRKIAQQASILDTRIKAITQTPSSEWYKITEYLIFNPEKSTLIYYDKDVPIAKQASQFLKIFLDAPEYYLKTEDLVKKLWGDLHEDTRLPQAINRFRAAIKPIPEISLKNIRGQGYQLIIKQEDNLPEEKS